ncbi:hypothetical protein B296_00035773 [Ensete ventricosum]|uniref:Uncharacterized protein n=1 Tax=Ensete ventricosum TaxID=4639 RepID=A0A426XYL2_ENSVE|nr:hypothetical protein B296_00035773 [Ensete ventricosum]
MESRSLRLGGIGQLFPEFLPDARVPRVEVICPQPRRALKSTSSVLDWVEDFGSKAKGILPALHGDHKLKNILDTLLGEDESEEELDSSKQTRFFCGSPPVRTNNPVIWDAHFGEENLSFTSPSGDIYDTGTPRRVERNSHSCGSSFVAKSEFRTEQFTPGDPDRRPVVSALS